MSITRRATTRIMSFWARDRPRNGHLWDKSAWPAISRCPQAHPTVALVMPISEAHRLDSHPCPLDRHLLDHLRGKVRTGDCSLATRHLYLPNPLHPHGIINATALLLPWARSSLKGMSGSRGGATTETRLPTRDPATLAHQEGGNVVDVVDAAGGVVVEAGVEEEESSDLDWADYGYCIYRSHAGR